MQKNNTMINKNIKSILIYIIAALTLFFNACSGKTPPVYTVTFDFGYNDYTETINTHGGTISSPDKPLRFGHTFDGWWYTDDNEERLWNFETDSVSRDITLKARWKEPERKIFTLTLDANGGECDITSVELALNQEYNLPIPTREDYYFDGWKISRGVDVTEGIWLWQYNYTAYAKWTTYPPGMTVKIGRFEQDNDLTNGPEDIEWYVIDYKDGKYFLFSKYILTGKSATNENTKNWETSILREWLNDEFYTSAFTGTEKSFICQTYLEDKNVTDNVFALSADEVINVVGAEEIMFGFKTEFTASQGAIEGAMIYYINVYSYHVRNGFVMCCTGSSSSNGSVFAGVRPGIWIREKYLNFENS